MEADDLKKRIQSFFGGAFQAISERSDIDARSVLRVADNREDGSVFTTLFPNPAMSYELYITDVEEKDNYWLVNTVNRGRWVFRKLAPADLSAYKAQMRGDGFSV